MPDLSQKLDYPIVFLFTITIGVVGLMAVMAWLFASLGWSGPLGLLKGGVMTGGYQQ